MRFKLNRLILNTARSLVALFVVLGMALSTSALAGEPDAAKASGQPDIVDTAINAESFTTLVAALQAAGLVDALKGDGPYTVFAPSDEAFERFNAGWPGTIESLLLEENRDKLTALLTYHVIPGKVMSTDLSGTMTPTTLEGSTVRITVTDSVKVDYATVVAADVETSNGVIHVIDNVIFPQPAGS